jgi:hypothetical protein
LRREFLPVLQHPGVPHLRGYGLEGADSRPVQDSRCLVNIILAGNSFVFRSTYAGVFTSTSSGIPLLGVVFNDFWTFIGGDTVNYPARAVFFLLSLPHFHLPLSEILSQPGD